jgi:hypothetical protein
MNILGSALLVGGTVRKRGVSFRACFSHTQSVFKGGGRIGRWHVLDNP